MSVFIKEEHVESHKPEVQQKKEKVGRWTKAECYLFESLLVRYGKNWKMIHQHMTRRTLSQIRSHAQKYFEKIGPNKVEEYEHRARLLEALETLEKEKQLNETGQRSQEQIQNKPEQIVKQEEESPMTGSQSGAPILETNIKEQCQKKIKFMRGEKEPEEPKKEELTQNHLLQEPQVSAFNSLKIENQRAQYHFPETNQQVGFLVSLFQRHPQSFSPFQGIEPFVDNNNWFNGWFM